MSRLTSWFKLLLGRQTGVYRTTHTFSCFRSSQVRTYADTPDVKSKQVMVQGPENEERMRVRRARPGDVPRLLRFVREHARTAWPGLATLPSESQLILCDYVARALAQGHCMLAEQQEARRGWSQIRGLALSVAVCPWDALLLEKWARCVRCARSRRLMIFKAHCMRAPALHDKYQVNNILQVVLIVPPDNSPKNAEVINILAKSAIKRGQELGFPLIRFDVTCDKMAKTLEELNLKKEWQLSYEIPPEVISETEDSSSAIKSIIKDDPKTGKSEDDTKSLQNKHHISVYTAVTKASKENKN